MSGPPPPPHLTSNYKQLLSINHTSSHHPPPDPNSPVTRPIQDQHFSFHSHNTQFQHDRSTEPYFKRPRFENNRGGAGLVNQIDHHQSTDDFPYEDTAVVAKGKEILKLLQQFPRPLSTKEIIKNCGHYFKLSLHPILVSLSDQGLILKQRGYGIESWRYNKNPSTPSPPHVPEPPPTHQYQHQQRQQQNPQQRWQGSPQNRFQQQPPSQVSPRSQFQQSCPQASPASQHSRHQDAAAPVIHTNKQSSTNFLISSDVYNALNKNPVSALNELVQKNGASLSFELLCENPGSHKNKFTVAAMINDKMYDAVSASNMKDAKRDAADAALKVILKEHVMDEPQTASSMNPSNSTHFDRIAMLSHRTFIAKSNMVKEKFAGRKVVACMIMQRDYGDEGAVVAMGTGNRCITGQRLSMEGKVVNDSHAEIVCRRALLSFLYTELDKHYSSQESIFEDGGYQGRSKLKDGVTFHLYISTAPCGDGALFTPRQQQNDFATADFPTEHSPTFSAKSHGTTRSKIEDGEGTIPIDTKDAEQTFDGILRGQRLRTMSCSDKICRWNVVGLQGALLSLLIEPVYLESLTLGYLYDHGHLSRAVCCRLDKGDVEKLDGVLPMPYYLNHPWIGRVTLHEASRETEKTNNISINWCLHDQIPEVTDGRTGAQLTRTDGAPTPSRLCKLELVKKFRCVVSRNEKYAHLLGDDCSYRELKDKAEDFQKAKCCMVDRFKVLKLGPWVKKPREQDIF